MLLDFLLLNIMYGITSFHELLFGKNFIWFHTENIVYYSSRKKIADVYDKAGSPKQGLRCWSPKQGLRCCRCVLHVQSYILYLYYKVLY